MHIFRNLLQSVVCHCGFNCLAMLPKHNWRSMEI